MIRIRTTSAILVFALAFSAAACSDDDPVSPDPLTMEDVAGTYLASGDVGVLTLTKEDDDPIDFLEKGAEIELELDADGVTAGRLFVPEGDEDGSDYEADLTGTWTLKGDTVQFKHSADTFLRDTKFIFKKGELVGSLEDSDGLIDATLVKS